MSEMGERRRLPVKVWVMLRRWVSRAEHAIGWGEVGLSWRVFRSKQNDRRQCSQEKACFPGSFEDYIMERGDHRLRVLLLTNIANSPRRKIDFLNLSDFDCRLGFCDRDCLRFQSLVLCTDGQARVQKISNDTNLLGP
jgi:hypothetical protein